MQVVAPVGHVLPPRATAAPWRPARTAPRAAALVALRRVACRAVRYDGQRLVTDADAVPGEVMWEERPLVVIQDPSEAFGPPEEDFLLAFRRRRCLEALEAFKKLPESTRAVVLSLYAPEAPEGSEDWRAELEASEGDAQGLRFLQVLRVNGVELGERTALYGLAARANHACRPLARLCVAESGMLRLVALKRLSAGEEVTVSYVSESDLLQPTAVRRRLLRSNWEFWCACSRCAAPDDRRCTFCPSCMAGRPPGLIAYQSRLVEMGRGMADLGHWNCCTSCGRQSEADLTELESHWVRRYEELPAWCQDARSLLPKASNLSLETIEEELGLEDEPQDEAAYVSGSLATVVELHRDFSQLQTFQAHWLAAELAAAAAFAGMLLLTTEGALRAACQAQVRRLRLERRDVLDAAERRLRALRGVFGGALLVEVAEMLCLQAALCPERAEELQRRAREIVVPLLAPEELGDLEGGAEELPRLLAKLR